MISLLRPVELVEYVLQIAWRNAIALVENLEINEGSIAPAPNADRRAGRRVFRCIVQQIEQYLLKEHGIQLAHRQIAGKLKLNTVLGKYLLRSTQRAAHDFSHILR